MRTHGKRFKNVVAAYDRERLYEPAEAAALVEQQTGRFVKDRQLSVQFRHQGWISILTGLRENFVGGRHCGSAGGVERGAEARVGGRIVGLLGSNALPQCRGVLGADLIG